MISFLSALFILGEKTLCASAHQARDTTLYYYALLGHLTYLTSLSEFSFADVLINIPHKKF